MSIGKLTRTAALCVGIALLTLAPGIGAGAARAGLETWAGALIPSLFPYCFMAIALQQTAGCTIGAHLGWLMQPFGCPAEGVGAFICGWLGGNLAGAKLTAMCAGEGRMSRGQCLRLGWLCTVCSPAFRAGRVGERVAALRLGTAYIKLAGDASGKSDSQASRRR